MREHISTEEAARRRRDLDRIQHSIDMEGQSVDPATLADGQKYAEGNISIEELVERTRARHGPPGPAGVERRMNVSLTHQASTAEAWSPGA